MTDRLTGAEIAALVERVFDPRPGDRAVAILVDLPDAAVPDREAWRRRRDLAADWVRSLSEQRERLGMPTHLVVYRNARTNNGVLPPSAWYHDAGPVPADAEALDPGRAVPFEAVFESHGILMAPTEFSATAPLKVAARRFGFRAATMPGFDERMIPALRIDYEEVHRRVTRLKALLDDASGAVVRFVVDGSRALDLDVDLRHRSGHASSGLLREPGTAGNLPSGEAYIVPYEGERPGDPSRTRGDLPVQIRDEVVVYRVEGNRAVEVVGDGREARAERDLLREEPAYGNLAELGLGVLADLGVQPVGELLVDEKLGLHVAFGRSDHFGGIVGPASFRSLDRVVHLDRIYLPSVQPRVALAAADLVLGGATRIPLIRDDRWVLDLSGPRGDAPRGEDGLP